MSIPVYVAEIVEDLNDSVNKHIKIHFGDQGISGRDMMTMIHQVASLLILSVVNEVVSGTEEDVNKWKSFIEESKNRDLNDRMLSLGNLTDMVSAPQGCVLEMASYINLMSPETMKDLLEMKALAKEYCRTNLNS